MTNKPEEGPHVPDTVALLEAQAKEIAEKDARIATLERRISECDDARDWLIERNRTLDARIAELEAALKKAAAHLKEVHSNGRASRAQYKIYADGAYAALKGAKA
jgi:chromosome segregation ATPase